MVFRNKVEEDIHYGRIKKAWDEKEEKKLHESLKGADSLDDIAVMYERPGMRSEAKRRHDEADNCRKGIYDAHKKKKEEFLDSLSQDTTYYPEDHD